MTRLPREGRNKTRLIAALGPAGATDFHERLAHHAIGRASSFALMHPGTRLRVCLEGGSSAEGRAWLGDCDCRSQSDGDLGQRLSEAIDEAFAEGARRVVVIGTDCPSLDETLLAGAFAALDRDPAVFGPAADGGYYLVGLAQPCPAVFREIEWGGPEVLRQSLEAARSAGIRAGLLDPRPDVDTPDDLPAGRAALDEGATLSIIIPALNDETRLPSLLDKLLSPAPHQVIIADGGSSDATPAVAERAGAKVVSAPRGRALQMNLAASMATGEFLLFLHADTLPPAGYADTVRRILRRPGTSAGAFRFELDGDLSAAPLIESLVHLRCRLRATPYGDQGLFIRRRLFRQLGGFPDWPVMEDIDLVRRLGRIGKVRLSADSALTSSRRWKEQGVIRTFLRHQLMLAAYHLRVPPARIARLRPYPRFTQARL